MKNRLERKISFLVVWLTMFSCILGYGQDFYKKERKADFLKLNYPGRSAILLYPNSSVYSTSGDESHPSKGVIQLAWSGNLVWNSLEKAGWQKENIHIQPSNLYYLQSGFFCKREWEIEKATRIPLRFRLGSLADCNAIEGKH